MAFLQRSRPVVLRSKLSLQQKISWLEQLRVLLSNGLALTPALVILARARDYRYISSSIVSDVSGGLLLSEALGRLPDFDDLDRALVAYGERTDNLLEFLGQLANLRQQQLSNRDRVTRALRYPLLVIVAATVITLALMSTVIPAFAQIFADAGQQLPWLSQKVFAASNWLLANWRTVVLALIALFLLALALRWTSLARYCSEALYWLPVISNIRTCYDQLLTVQFLLAGARCQLAVVNSLQLLPEATFARRQQLRLRVTLLYLQQGEPLISAFARTRALSTDVLQLLATGVSSGDLIFALVGARRWLELELARGIERSVAVLQPTLNLLMGAFIALVVVAIYLPLLSIGQAL